MSSSAADAQVPLPENLWTRKSGVDWPRFLGPTGDSRSPEKGILTKLSEAGPKIVWQTELGTSYGAPTVARGRLYQFDRYGDKARLTAMNAENGKPLWRFEYATKYSDYYGYNNGPRCSPVVDGGRVYLHGVEGMLHCVRATDGKLLWKVDTVAKYGVVQNFFGVGSTPVVYGDLLIVHVGGSPDKFRGTGPGGLSRVEGNGTGIVAFDKITGEEKYRLTDELASYASPTLAEIDGRPWCFVLARGGLVGFDPRNGKVDFRFPWRARTLESVNASTPVVVGDEVFISETYGPGSALLKVKPGGYDVVWKDDPRKREKAMQTHWNTAVYHDGYLYASSGRHTSNAELRCIEWKTGKVMWSVPRLSRCSLTYADGHLICLSEYGQLILLKATPNEYAPVWDVTLHDPRSDRLLLNYPAWAAPVLSHGLLYVRGKDRLVCLVLIAEE